MSDTASLELSRTLYELSGWYSNPYWYRHPGGMTSLAPAPDRYGEQFKKVCPAYSFDYLMSKLPRREPEWGTGIHLKWIVRINEWSAGYVKGIYTQDEDPTNAVCKLAIELWKQGVLK